MRTFTVARLWGIPIRISVSLVVFLPVLAWIIGSGTQLQTYASFIDLFSPAPVDVATLRAGGTAWAVGMAAAVGLFASVTIHELGHAWAARRYGVETRAITLWLLGGIATLDSLPREWETEFWIALAGPAASLLTAVGWYLLLVPASAPATVFVAGWLVVTNLALVGFNLLPAFPLDGGRVLRAFLARSRSHRDATRATVRLGTGFAILCAVVGALTVAPLLLLLALFLYGAATTESRSSAVEWLLGDLTVGDVGIFDIAGIDADATLAECAELTLQNRRTVLPVMDDGVVVGTVTADTLRGLGKRNRKRRTVRSLMHEDVPRVSPRLDAFEALGVVNRHESGTALLELNGDVVGVVSLDEFVTVLNTREAQERAAIRAG